LPPKTQQSWRASRTARAFEDASVANPSQRDVSVHEDRYIGGDWRVEYFDADGGCYVTIFAGQAAEERARDYFNALNTGRLKTIREPFHH
jgi:hypothetical protein